MPFKANEVFLKKFKKNQILINQFLEKIIAKSKVISSFKEPLAYALLGGGKRMRANLVFLTHDLALNIKKEKKRLNQDILKIAASIECIHTYSLVHDDLPAMDDDSFRRERETVHVKYDEPTAILVGDALLNLAFEILSTLKSNQLGKIMGEISSASGALGMVSGQYLDLKAENKQIQFEELVNLHGLKTGKMFLTSILSVVFYHDLLKYKPYLATYGKSIGLAFQVIDDILDVTQESKVLGKDSGSDLKNNKSTFVSLLGVAKARQKATHLTEQACSALEKLKKKSDDKNINIEDLTSLANLMLHRIK